MSPRKFSPDFVLVHEGALLCGVRANRPKGCVLLGRKERGRGRGAGGSNLLMVSVMRHNPH